MVENDIYDSQTKYERFKSTLEELAKPSYIHRNGKTQVKRKYYCKNADNLKYFRKLLLKIEAIDLSFVRRLRLLQKLKIVVHNTNKDLAQLQREDIDKIVAFVNTKLSPKTAADFRKDLRYMWKLLLPEKDEKGRVDENLTPYVVRHLKGNIHKSRQKTRNDRFSWEDFEKLLKYFSSKPSIQCYLMLAVESLARPQELFWRRIKDVELHDNYAIVHLTDHTKTGCGIAQAIDSYACLVKWLNNHPFREQPEQFLFVNHAGKQLNPAAVNKHLRIACKRLGINKQITCYSLKRNGVTFRRLRGDSDVEIQHAARWSSTRQLKTYDLSAQQDALKMELVKRGLIDAEEDMKHLQPKTKPCLFCKAMNSFTNVTCVNCNRPLNREKVAELEHEREITILNDFVKRPEIRQQLQEFVIEVLKKSHKLKKS